MQIAGDVYLLFLFFKMLRNNGLRSEDKSGGMNEIEVLEGVLKM